MKKYLWIAWLTVAPFYSSLGNGNKLELFNTNDISTKIYIQEVGSYSSAEDYRNEYSGIDMGYRLTSSLDGFIGGGYDRYNLYGAPSTYTKDVHVGLKVRIY